MDALSSEAAQPVYEDWRANLTELASALPSRPHNLAALAMQLQHAGFPNAYRDIEAHEAAVHRGESVTLKHLTQRAIFGTLHNYHPKQWRKALLQIAALRCERDVFFDRAPAPAHEAPATAHLHRHAFAILQELWRNLPPGLQRNWLIDQPDPAVKMR